jgi:hypothetical protein
VTASSQTSPPRGKSISICICPSIRIDSRGSSGECRHLGVEDGKVAWKCDVSLAANFSEAISPMASRKPKISAAISGGTSIGFPRSCRDRAETFLRVRPADESMRREVVDFRLRSALPSKPDVVASAAAIDRSSRDGSLIGLRWLVVALSGFMA